jgi:1,2-diacylglycerol 3-alpha-glucosyltransferase
MCGPVKVRRLARQSKASRTMIGACSKKAIGRMRDVPSGGSRDTLVIQWPRLGPYHVPRVRTTSAYFQERGWRVVALETASRDETYAWEETEQPRGFEHVRLFPDGNFDELRPRDIHRKMMSALSVLDPGAVAINSYSAPDARSALEWCRRNRRVAVVMVDSRREDAKRSLLREALKRRIVRSFDAALTAGTPHVEYLRELGLPDDVIFTPYDVVDNDWHRSEAEHARQDPAAGAHLPGLDDPRPFFLASNRFVPRKNVGMLIDAYSRYREGAALAGEPPWRLVLLGDGPLRADLEQQAAATGGEDVTFAGFRPMNELLFYYGLASAFVHPAAADQWGLVVNEAMASGLPVLVSRGAGCAPDLVTDGITGFSFDPRDRDRLADLLRRVATMNPAQRASVGGAAQQHIQNYSLEAFARGLMRAVSAGRRSALTTRPVAGRAILAALRLVTTRTNSFHAIQT